MTDAKKETATDPIAAVAAEAAAEQRAATADAKAPAGDKKPKRTRTRAARSGPQGGRPAGTKTGAGLAGLDTRITELLTLGGVMVSGFNPADGAVILANAEPVGKALHALAKENPAVQRVLLGLLQTSAWGGVIMAVFPIVVGIAANHGKLPPALAAFGGAPVETPGGEHDPTSNGAADPASVARLLG